MSPPPDPDETPEATVVAPPDPELRPARVARKTLVTDTALEVLFAAAGAALVMAALFVGSGVPAVVAALLGASALFYTGYRGGRRLMAHLGERL